MDVYDVNCEVPLGQGGVAEEIAEPGETAAGICDGGGDEARLACEGLDGFVVPREGAGDGHAGATGNAEVGLVEAEDCVGAVVCYVIGDCVRPVLGEGGVIVEEEGDEAQGVGGGAREDAAGGGGVGLAVVVVSPGDLGGWGVVVCLVYVGVGEAAFAGEDGGGCAGGGGGGGC